MHADGKPTGGGAPPQLLPRHSQRPPAQKYAPGIQKNPGPGCTTSTSTCGAGGGSVTTTSPGSAITAGGGFRYRTSSRTTHPVISNDAPAISNTGLINVVLFIITDKTRPGRALIQLTFFDFHRIQGTPLIAWAPLTIQTRCPANCY